MAPGRGTVWRQGRLTQVISTDWPSIAPEEPITLACGAYQATVAPSMGGRLASLQWMGDQQTVDLLIPMGPQTFSPHAWPKAGAFPMIPFSNRLPAGELNIGGRTVTPDAGPHGHPLHGFAHRRPWLVEDQSEDMLVMSFLHDGLSEGWPWKFRAAQRITVADHGIAVELSVTNLDATSMPIAIGWHPYHPCSGSEPHIYIAAVGGPCLELDGTRAAEHWVCDSPRSLLLPHTRTVALSDWIGRLCHRLPSGLQLVVNATGFCHLVAHRPTEGDYFCAEPVNVLPGHFADAENVPVLAGGETVTCSWRCGINESISHPVR